MPPQVWVFSYPMSNRSTPFYRALTHFPRALKTQDLQNQRSLFGNSLQRKKTCSVFNAPQKEDTLLPHQTNTRSSPSIGFNGNFCHLLPHKIKEKASPNPSILPLPGRAGGTGRWGVGGSIFCLKSSGFPRRKQPQQHVAVSLASLISRRVFFPIGASVPQGSFHSSFGDGGGCSEEGSSSDCSESSGDCLEGVSEDGVGKTC